MSKTPFIARTLFVALSALAAGQTQAAVTSINLASYTVTGNYALDSLNDMGLEASAVTYARDRFDSDNNKGTLFFVGDEGMGVVEVSRTGITQGSMAFSAWPAATSHNDAEGLTYLGNGVLVVSEERLQDAIRFSYVKGGSVNLATAPWSSVANYAYNNTGLEGISYDASNGTFVAVKQDSPQVLLTGTLSFESDVDGGVSTMTETFNAASLFGLNSLSDIQTLSSVDHLAGQAAAENLLILSLDSKKLVEINRIGTVLSQFDLSGVTSQAIEGVTVDEKGTIYLVAEDSGTPNSRLFVLPAPVPEPETYALMLAGLGLVGFMARRHKA